MSIPSNPDALLMRKPTADALSEVGYPITAVSLNVLAHRGTGPKYYKFGKNSLYRWRDALEWAEAKLGEPRSSHPRGSAIAEAASGAAADPRLIAAERNELDRAPRAETRTTVEPASEPVE